MRGGKALFAVALVVIASCGSSAKHSRSTTVTTGSTVAPTIAPTPSTVPPEIGVLEAYVDAFNRGDAHAAALTFAANAQFSTTLGTCSPCVGRSTIEQKLAAAITAGTKLHIVQPKLSGNTVTGPSSLTSSRFPPGVQRAIGSFSATVSDGKITQLAQTYDRSDPQTAALFKSLGQ